MGSKRGPAALLLRSFLIQGSWNYRNLLGTGMAWALLSRGREPRAGETEEGQVRRMAESFNAHPYLTPIALGALDRVEQDGADPLRIHELRTALRSPLGGLGDALFWGGWRPVLLLLALLAALLGTPPLLTVAFLLVGYNLLHLRLRHQGLRIGLEGGFGLAPGIRSLSLPLRTERIRGVGVLLLGSVLGALATQALQAPGAASGWVFAGLGFFLAGVVGGDFLRKWAPGILLFLALFGGWF